MPVILDTAISRRAFLAGAAASVAVLGLPQLAGAQNKNTLHLAMLSDTHIPGDRQNGHRGFNPWENLKSIVPDVVAAAPEGVIVNGDAARLQGLPEDYTEFLALLEPVAQVAPIYIGLGNHDDRANLLAAVPKPDGTLAPVDGRLVTIIEHPIARIIMLDSLHYVNQVHGLLGKAQREWLASYLQEHTDRPVVLCLHHTLGDSDGDLLDSDRFFALLEPHKHVKAIFYGHSHFWTRSERQGIQLINLPAVGYNFRDDQPVGWVDALFHPDGVRLTLHACGGNTAEDGKVTEIAWL